MSNEQLIILLIRFLIFDAAVQENPQLSDVPLPELVSLLPDSLSNAEVYSIVNQYQTLLRDDCAAGSVLSFHELHSLTEQLKESHLSEQTLSLLELVSNEQLIILLIRFVLDESLIIF